MHSTSSLTIPDYLLRLVRDRPESELLLVGNKVDVLEEGQKKELVEKEVSLSEHQKVHSVSWVSCLSGEGLDDFTSLLRVKVEAFTEIRDEEEEDKESTLFLNERHLAHLQATTAHLQEVLASVKRADLAITASRLRQAAHQLACLTGRITTEDVLDVLFKDFCIGK